MAFAMVCSKCPRCRMALLPLPLAFPCPGYSGRGVCNGERSDLHCPLFPVFRAVAAWRGAHTSCMGLWRAGGLAVQVADTVALACCKRHMGSARVQP